MPYKNREDRLRKSREHYEKNKDEIKKSAKVKRDSATKDECEKRRLYFNKWQEENKEKVSKYRKTWEGKNKDLIRETKKKYHADKAIERRELGLPCPKPSPESVEAKKKRMREKRATNKVFAISSSMRARTAAAFRGIANGKKPRTESLIGCDFVALKAHIEAQFTDGMSWDNYGRMGWHIDHRIPLASAKTHEDLERLCHFSNLQPLWWRDNLVKGDSMPPQD